MRLFRTWLAGWWGAIPPLVLEVRRGRVSIGDGALYRASVSDGLAGSVTIADALSGNAGKVIIGDSL